MTQGGGTVVTWETSSEVQTLGFHLWRSATGKREDAIQVTDALVVATGSSDAGAVYTYTDIGTEQGIHYTYWLEEVQLDGSVRQVGTVQPQFIGMLYLPLIAEK